MRADSSRLGCDLQQRRLDDPQAIGQADDDVGNQEADQRRPERDQEGHEQEQPEEGQADDQAGQRARDQHGIVEQGSASAAIAMPGQANQQVEGDRDRTTYPGEQDRVQDAARQARDLEDRLEIGERQLLRQPDALAPVLDEGTQYDAADRKEDRDQEPQPDQPQRDRLAGAAQPEQIGSRPLPPTAAKRRAWRSKRRWMKTSGRVIRIRNTVTAAMT